MKDFKFKNIEELREFALSVSPEDRAKFIASLDPDWKQTVTHVLRMSDLKQTLNDANIIDHYYYIEELIPAKIAIGGKDFWHRLESDYKRPNRCDDESDARDTLKRMRRNGRTVRLVETVIREVEI